MAFFTLAIAVNDLMNLHGQFYSVTAVGAAVVNGGENSYAVTLNDSNSTVVTVKPSNCILEDHNPAGNRNRWVQSAVS